MRKQRLFLQRASAAARLSFSASAIKIVRSPNSIRNVTLFFMFHHVNSLTPSFSIAPFRSSCDGGNFESHFKIPAYQAGLLNRSAMFRCPDVRRPHISACCASRKTPSIAAQALSIFPEAKRPAPVTSTTSRSGFRLAHNSASPSSPNLIARSRHHRTGHWMLCLHVPPSPQHHRHQCLTRRKSPPYPTASAKPSPPPLKRQYDASEK